MLLALSGVTGIGKTYFTEQLAKELGFNKITTIRTRKKRPGEENGKTGIFMTEEELDELKKQGKIVYDFKVFGGRYAYLKEEVFSNENMVFEMHYTMINDWKKIKPDIKTIYIFPEDIEVSKNKTSERNLSKEKEEERIKEIEEQYNIMQNDKNLREKFDYIIYNRYNEESKNEIINLVKKILQENEN